MFLKRCLILFCMLSLLTLAAVAESPLSFPCDSELSPFLSRSEHDVTFKIDLENNYRIETDYWGDEPMLVESGSFLMNLCLLTSAFQKNMITRRITEETCLT
mgnify:CR=1 FL=1